MLTGDSSKANFAAALVSAGPADREFQAWQAVFTPLYESIYRSVMVAGAAAGSLKADAEEMAEMKISTVWPTIEVRDDKEHTEANAIRKLSGFLSGRTWTEEDGRDWEVERERRRVELEDASAFEPPAAEWGGPSGARGRSDTRWSWASVGCEEAPPDWSRKSCAPLASASSRDSGRTRSLTACPAACRPSIRIEPSPESRAFRSMAAIRRPNRPRNCKYWHRHSNE